jgi:prephenate dehydrogenase
MRGLLPRSTVGVVGLGLIGGSLALALRPKVRRLIGIDPDASARRLALRRRGVHEASADYRRLASCGWAIVAVPQAKTVSICARAARHMRPGTTLFEVASVKGPVAAGIASIPSHVNLISAHPMAGTERAGMANAFSGLFEGRPLVLIPARVADRESLALARELAAAIGAKEKWMLDAARHDDQGARLIHLPHLIAYALARLDVDRAMAGPSYGGATRVAHSLPSMVAEMLHANRRAVRRNLPGFVRELRRLARLLDSPARLEKALAAVRKSLER